MGRPVRSACRKLFWALVFLFDFQVHGLDILPDWIGYILFAIALTQLAPAHSRFARGRIYAVVLTVLSVGYAVWSFGQRSTTAPTGGYPSVAFAVLSLTALLDLLMIWDVCEGIAALARAVGYRDLARSAFVPQVVYAASVVLFWLVALPWWFKAGKMVGIVVAAGVAAGIVGFIAILLLMGLVRRAGRDLGNLDEDAERRAFMPAP